MKQQTFDHMKIGDTQYGVTNEFCYLWMYRLSNEELQISNITLF